MPAPVPSWDLVRVYGTWRSQGGALKSGTYKVTVPARITNIANDAIIPAGLFASGSLQVAVDGNPSLDVLVPATDDPDNEQTGWKLVIEVTFPDATAEAYVIDIPVANRPSGSGGNGLGVNLRQVALTDQLPQQVAMYKVGVANGVARLNSNGDVVNAAGTPITGGGGGGSTDEYVVYYSGGAYPAQPGSPPGGIKRRQFYGPVQYAGPTWSGVIDLYTYVALT